MPICGPLPALWFACVLTVAPSASSMPAGMFYSHSEWIGVSRLDSECYSASPFSYSLGRQNAIKTSSASPFAYLHVLVLLLVPGNRKRHWTETSTSDPSREIRPWGYGGLLLAPHLLKVLVGALPASCETKCRLPKCGQT